MSDGSTTLVLIIIAMLAGLGVWGWGFAIGSSPIDAYRDCRKIATIETCVKHTRIEKGLP